MKADVNARILLGFLNSTDNIVQKHVSMLYMRDYIMILFLLMIIVLLYYLIRKVNKYISLQKTNNSHTPIENYYYQTPNRIDRYQVL